MRIVLLVIVLVMAPTAAFFFWAWGVKIKQERKLAGTLPDWQDLPLTWLAIAFGMSAKSVAGANSSTLLLQFGPFISSGFVPPDTMPPGVRWFAENQPFTSMIETMRGLLLGTPIGNSAYIAIAWCIAIALIGYLWSRTAYNRDPIRQA